ncbi:MAG TPA: glycosyltransferase family A protein [Pyrinomonadaceae bacterium]|jgi:glycosyltransferase involved in cell wall biosynthesis|nr:glycosyltransferase family A protein [Pyrinomonadaceae bacterium]
MPSSPRESPRPAVSVVVAAYNAAAFIGDTLASVFAQTFGDFELIVVNDGSRDTPALESALAPYLERIVYVAQENRGAGAARNRALREARAPLVAFLDADDQWLPTYLEEQAAFLEAGGYDLVYADAEIFGDPPFAGRTFMQTAPSEGEVNFASLLSGRCNVITSGVLARKSLVLEVGLFDEGLRNAQDFDLWVRMIRAGARAGYRKKVLLRYRHHAGSLSGDAANRVARELIVLDKIDTYDLTAGERAEVSKARERVRANVALESGKRHLARGRFAEAREEFSRANASRGSWKLRAVVLALRVAPRLVLWAAKRRLDDSA